MKLVRTLHNISLAYGNQGDIEKKREMLERSVAIKRANYDVDSLELAISLRPLGHVYFDLSNGGVNVAHHARHVEILTEVLVILEAQPEPKLDEINKVRLELRGIYSKPSVRRVPSRVCPQENELTSTAREIDKNAVTRFNNLDYEGAAPLFKQVFDSLNQITPFAMETGLFAATAYSYSEQHTESLALLNTLLLKVQETFGLESLEEARVYFAIAKAKGKACDKEGEAFILENTVIPLFTKWLGPLAKDTLRARALLVNTNGSVKNADQVDMLMAILEQMITTLPPDAIEIKRTEANLVNSIGKQGENEQKRSLVLLKVLEMKERKYGKDHVVLVTTLLHIGLSYDYQGDYEKELEMFERCMTISKNYYEPNSIEHVPILRAKARVHFHFSRQQNCTIAQEEHYKKYIECLKEAKRILDAQTGAMPKEYSDRLERINKELAGTKAANYFSQYHPLTFFGDTTCRLTGFDPVCIYSQKFNYF